MQSLRSLALGAVLLPSALAAQTPGQAITGAVPTLQRTPSYVESFDRGRPEEMLGGALRIGTDGAWSGRVHDGIYELVNGTAEQAVKYFYLTRISPGPDLAGEPVQVQADVSVAADDPLAGAGIVVRADRERRTYLLFVVGPQGYAVVQRSLEGTSIPIRGSIGRLRTDRPVTLTARPAGGAVEFLIGDRSIATLDDPAFAGIGVGIGAIGRGTFRFHRVAVTAAGGSRQATAPAPPAPVAPPTPYRQATARVTLQSHHEPEWFSIDLPSGWRLAADRARGHIAAFGERASAHIRPFFLPGAGGEAAVRAVLSAHARDVAERTRWGAVHRFDHGGRVGLRSVGEEGGIRRVAAIGVVPTQEGVAGIFWLVSAPAHEFDGTAPLFAAMLESFRPERAQPGAPSPSGGQPSLSYVSFADPGEGAFSTEVPRGWKVDGGTVRKSAVDVRHAVRVESPDGWIVCWIGDASIPPFSEPGPLVREGTWYTPLDTPLWVQRYTPGEQFAQWYARAQLDGRVLEGMRVDVVQPLPEATRTINRMLGPRGSGGFDQRADVGEVRLSGRFRGEPAVGHIVVETRRLGLQGVGGVWSVNGVYGIVARQDRVGEAGAALSHMIASYRLDPRWFAQQQRTTARTVEITAETNEYISGLIRSGYADVQARLDRVHAQGSDARRGIVRLIDPQTGQGYEVQAGSRYHWITDRGVIVGTNSHWNPGGLYFREMLQVDR